jgi:hypothetical protein
MRMQLRIALLVALNAASSAFMPFHTTSHTRTPQSHFEPEPTSQSARQAQSFAVPIKHVKILVRTSKSPKYLQLDNLVQACTIEKHRALLEMSRIQEQKLLTRKELSILNGLGNVRSAGEESNSTATTFQPWRPSDLDVDHSNVMGLCKRIRISLSLKEYSGKLAAPLYFMNKLAMQWITIFLFRTYCVLNSAWSVEQQELDEHSSLPSKLNFCEARAESTWKNVDALENEIDDLIEMTTYLLSAEYMPPFRSMSDFRDYIAARAAAELRAGRPSVLFSAAPTLLRTRFRRRIFWGNPSPAKVRNVTALP